MPRGTRLIIREIQRDSAHAVFETESGPKDRFADWYTYLVRDEGKWKIDNVRIFELPPAHYLILDSLEAKKNLADTLAHALPIALSDADAGHGRHHLRGARHAELVFVQNGMSGTLAAEDAARPRSNVIIRHHQPKDRVPIKPTSILPLLLLFAIGCGGSTSPDARTTRVYVLRTVGGRHVPGMVDSTYSEWDSVASDTLTLDFNVDSATDFFRAHVDYPPSQQRPGGGYADFHVLTKEQFIIRGDSIFLALPNTDCFCYVNREGVIGLFTITVRMSGDYSSNPEYVYHLISSSQ
jgi:hypothetical protein